MDVKLTSLENVPANLRAAKQGDLVLLLHATAQEGYLARFKEIINGGAKDSIYLDTLNLIKITPVHSLDGIPIANMVLCQEKGIPRLHEYTVYLGATEVRSAFAITPWLKPYNALMTYEEERVKREEADARQETLPLITF